MICCVINGRFLAQPVTGVQRYAIEVVSALDSALDAEPGLRSKYSFEVLSTRNGRGKAVWSHIPVRTVGRRTGHLWEQTELPRYLHGRLLIGLANTGPIRVSRQIATIHDASIRAAPAGYSLSFRLWYRFVIRNLGKAARRIVTDSHFSRDELHRWFDISTGKITIIPLGADHILRQPADYAVVDRRSLTERPFVLTAGSLNPNKNLGALFETAAQLNERGVDLLVAGGANERVFGSMNWAFPPNVRYLGYVSDAELRALYERAICFVFPSMYEGFGLPPLEAMTCGCPVVTSNAASLPEVCGEAACYADPNDPQDIARRVMEIVSEAGAQTRLRRLGKERAASYSWAETARRWLQLIEECD